MVDVPMTKVDQGSVTTTTGKILYDNIVFSNSGAGGKLLVKRSTNLNMLYPVTNL